MELEKIDELTQNDLININGGNVPVSYYMDSDTIHGNENLFSFFAGIFVGFFS